MAVIDGLVWAVVLLLVALLTHDLSVAHMDVPVVVTFGLVAACVAVLLGVVRGLYAGHWRVGSADEIVELAAVTGICTVALVALELLLLPTFPLSAVIGGAALSLVLVAGVRLVIRLVVERELRPEEAACVRTVVVGAGEAGARVIASMLRTPSSRFVPVALVDDDPRKHRLSILGVPVRGHRADLADVIRSTGATTVVIAIPSATADGALLRDITDRVAATGAEVLALPPVSELFSRAVQVGDVRPVTAADLLGRREVEVDIEAIAGYLAGRRVLITGAGGSIGSELCRQLHRLGLASLVMLDRDESALHAVQLSMLGTALLDSRDLVVADIRDVARLDAVFKEHQPHVVFHAAALKHLPLLEMHPCEAVKSNVQGTWNMLRVSTEHGVERFVNISTDKAADPTSVLGYSKRLAERLTAGVVGAGGPTAVSVRFGNVLGSRGSVLTTFEAQIARGGPVTVTDPMVTRFFMTVEEAVRLVIQAGAVGRAGEVLVLDMGEPVNIDAVARRLIENSRTSVDIVYTGLRAGEKLDEVLLGEGERDERPVHPLISHVSVPPLDPAALAELYTDLPRQWLVQEMARLCTVDGARTDVAPDKRVVDVRTTVALNEPLVSAVVR